MMKNRTARVRFAALAVALVLNGGLLTVAAHAEDVPPLPPMDGAGAPPADLPPMDGAGAPPADLPPMDAPPADALGAPPVSADAMMPPPGLEAAPAAPEGELPPPPGADMAAPPALDVPGEMPPPPGGDMATPPAPEMAAPPAPAEPAPAEAPAAEPAGKKTSYAVKKGDSLWKISGKTSVYGDSFQWPLIFIGNRDKIKDPDIIKPSWKLKINQDVASDAAQAAISKAKETPRYVPHTTPRKRLPIEY